MTLPRSREMRLAAGDDLARPLHLERQAEFQSQHVDGPGRHDPQQGLRRAGHRLVPGAGHAVGDLVDGAVAPYGHDDVGLGSETLGEDDGFLGVARGVELALEPALGQRPAPRP